MPELRIDPICGRRVYIAEERAGRPNDFLTSAGEPEDRSATSAASPASRARCPFCAGHEAETPVSSASVLDDAGNWLVRVVPNKFPAVALSAGGGLASVGDDAARPQAALGAHEVIIESPEHFVDLTALDEQRLTTVLATYRDRLRHWSADRRLRHATVFKNSGFAAGASLEHLHSQLVALPCVPLAIEAELDGAARFFASHGQCVFCDLVRREIASGERLVVQGDGYVAIAAYAGRQPYETWILPERHAAQFDTVDDADLLGLARILTSVLQRLTAVSSQKNASLAYNLILHSGPWEDAHAATYHWHWELVPRTAQLAGLELGSGIYINSVSPERAAKDLRKAISSARP